MSRCKYGKLKHPVGGRRCKRRSSKGKKSRRHGRRRSRKTSPLLSGVGIGVVLVGAAVLVPQLLG